MNPTLDQARREVVVLANQIFDLCNDNQPWAAKAARVHELERQLNAADKQCSELRNEEYLTAQRKRYAGAGDALGGALGDIHAPAGAVLGSMAPLTLGGAQVETLFKSARDRLPVVVKADTSTVAPAQYPMQFLPPVTAAREPFRILDLLPQQAADSAVVRYYRTTGTAAAAPVAEGEEKPQSDIAFTAVDASPTKIAHFVTATDESLADFTAFTGLLQQDMIAGVINAENAALLAATGGSPSTFEGLLVVDGTQSYQQASGESMLDAIESGASLLRAGGRFVEADGVILHPLDYSAARRTKSTMATYIAGDPTQTGPASLWGLPVKLTSQIARGTALVGRFAEAAMVWVREAAGIRVDPYTLSTSNKVQIICEERIALGVLAPAALCKVELTETT